jgi:hypothetical protein
MEDNPDFCKLFTDPSICNPKGHTFPERFIDILSDPNNLLIPRCEGAGTIKDNCIILHNGIKVLKNSYYEEFSEIFVLNRGVHEPAEERMFGLILKDIRDGGVMLELGSYWAFYTMWFHQKVKNAKNYCIEPIADYLDKGKQHCALNNVVADFTQGYIGNKHIRVSEFLKQKGLDQLDLLHSDIQGFELEMLQDIAPLLRQNKIKYLFISTHSDELHSACIDLLKANDYKIIASADFSVETFCYDGVLVACHVTNQTFGTYDLGNRQHTQLRKTSYV